MREEPGETEPPSLEERRTEHGRLPGDRYVRYVRPPEFRRERGVYVTTPGALAPAGRLGRAYEAARRLLLGRRLPSEAEVDERLSKKTGLAVLASDNISSSAYATEEAMRVLALAGTAALALTMPIAVAVVAVLAIVVLSESRVIRAYPSGGGSYAVAKDNLGVSAALVAAAALLIDYVLTVAVSTAAGIAAIGSFLPALHDERALWGILVIAALALGNLRGIREAGMLFATPTYLYVVAMGGLIAFGLLRVLAGDVPAAARPPDPFDPVGPQVLGILLILRAFASGAVGLTGSEAVANGTPSFRPPEARNAVVTLVLMGTIFAAVFLGVSYLATTIGVVPDEHEAETLNSVLTRSIVGTGPYYYLVQGATAIILLLAANTGFTGFPRLASVLANDRFMPRQFAFRGERLAFSFGIVALAAVAGAVLWAFDGSVTHLIPLYTIGVFLAFTLSQTGLVRRWLRLRDAGWRASVVINTIGAVVTGLALVVVAATKFQSGAWMVLLVLPLLVLLLYGVNRHYRTVADALIIDERERPIPAARPLLVIVPVARLDRAALRAVAFARSISSQVVAVHVATSDETAREFQGRWKRWAPEVKLDVIESPFRSLVLPLIRYIDAIGRHGAEPVTIVLAEFVPRHWWEFLLHSQTAFRLKASLLFRPNTVVIDVPYHFAEPGRDGEPTGGRQRP